MYLFCKTKKNFNKYSFSHCNNKPKLQYLSTKIKLHPDAKDKVGWN